MVMGLAEEGRHHVAAARRVLELARWAGLAGKVVVAPFGEGDDHREQVAAARGQVVLVAGRAVLVADTRQDSVVHQGTQPVGQDVAGDPETGEEAVEAGHTKESVPNDQQGPAFTDQLKAACHRAHLAVIGPSQHCGPRYPSGWLLQRTH